MTEENGTGAEPVSAADRLATEIRRRRRAAGLSQRELARLCGYTREYISMAERLGANVPSRELVRTLDHVLDADGTLVTLRSHAADEQRTKRVTRTHTAAKPDLLDGVRRAMLGPPGEPMVGIGDAIARAHAHYQSADYDDAARLLPRVIHGLTGSPAHAKATAYLAAAKVATKVGDAGLAWVAADRCATYAAESGHADLTGVARYQVAA
ncbi:MAG: helix-turn-helix transcriptional regulator, partial [Actinomycetota bacterium]|nr:helix-turn-helix transcriptional regulator [Actinomycetota bacterium]